jgi:hypothetical protein
LNLAKLRLLFQQKSPQQSGSKNVLETTSQGTVQRLLAIIEKPHATILQIDAEITFVSHQKNPRTFVDMAVVVNVHQDMIFDEPLLDPGMKHWNQVTQIQLRGFAKEDFDTQAL